MATDEEVKTIIQETISQLHAEDAQLLLKKPRTIQGWVYVLIGLGSIVAFMWGSVVFLNDIAEHSKAAHHEGTEEILAEIRQDHVNHIYDKELHRGEAELELKILKATEPLKNDISNIKEDVRQIQSSVDILVDHVKNRNVQ